jgi:FMN-dependent NADH-azoreductase
MKKILSIQSSINGERSVSKKLSASVIDHLKTTYPGSELYTRDLSDQPVPHLEAAQFIATRTPHPDRTASQLEAAAYAEDLVNEIFDADFIVIGVPFYNFSIPSTLKSWLDHIAIPGKTFSYKGEDGRPAGLIKDKKVYLAIAQGGIYSEEPMKSIDNTESYLRTFLGFLGMTDVSVFRADGMSIPDVGEKNLSDTMHIIEEFAF